MNRLFNSVKLVKPKNNLFDLSHEKKLSFNMGELIPIMLHEVIPGDKFKGNSEVLLRLAPMVSPIMHRVNVYVHYFFVPNRLIYANWESYITGGTDGLSAPGFPTLSINDTHRAKFLKGSLADYFGLPVCTDVGLTTPYGCNALPFRAYQLIYNEYYRDQTLQTAIALTKNDTVDATEHAAITALRNRCWEKDYFTSALPWTQRGGEVMLPGNETITYRGTALTTGAGANTSSDVANTAGIPNGTLSTGGGVIGIDNISDIQYNITVNDMRRAAKLQNWLERNAIGGSRYVEQILAHFGVKSSDARLQRPEYLGGGKQNVVISEVLNTSSTATEPQGNMAGHGISVGNSNTFKKYFEEHGYVLGILSVLPRTAYQQGLNRKFTKSSKYDWFWPELANIGEQAIPNNEVYLNPMGAYTPGTFGYQSRYAEYKYEPSTVHGEFRDTLSHWHLGRIFASQPALNSAFVSSDPSHRVFAVTDVNVDKLYCQVYNNVKAIRPMPKFGAPGIHVV